MSNHNSSSQRHHNSSSLSPDNLQSCPSEEHEECQSENDDSWFLPCGIQQQFQGFHEYAEVSPAVIEELVEGKPGDFYIAVVDNSILEMIADETNLYVAQ